MHETDNLQLYLYFLRPAAWNQVAYSNHFSPTFLKPWLKLEDQDPTAQIENTREEAREPLRTLIVQYNGGTLNKRTLIRQLNS